ncbi:MAG: tetratricopeptide repeat protein [Deltaproteobacteria bacterium]|nr:tetratricopeptide repeat protein [Deltaproteobacteria bacterium]
MWVSLLALLAGCGASPDPELAQQREVLDLWERGSQQLAQRSGDLGLADLTAAAERQGGPVLAAWEASALARSGREEEALDLLTQVVRQNPDFYQARYNRAAILAHTERLEESALELERALEDGGLRPGEVLEDPDFAAVLDDPSFAFLPDDVLDVRTELSPGPLFVGGLWVLAVELDADPGQVVAVTAPRVMAPLRCLGGQETQRSDGRRRLEWVFRVTSGGSFTLGPLALRVGERTVQLPARSVRTLAPEGWVGDLSPLSLTSSSAGLGAHPLPSAWRTDGAIWAALPPGSAIRAEGPTPGAVCLDYREQDLLIWRLCRYQRWEPDALRIERGGELLWADSLSSAKGAHSAAD